MAGIMAKNALFNLAFPFETIEGLDAFYQTAYAPLFQRPCPISSGAITSSFRAPRRMESTGSAAEVIIPGRSRDHGWTSSPPGHLVHMRFHEFYRFDNNKVVEFQGLWDIPEVMMQAGAWPMQPSLGKEWHVPGPATQDGLVPGPYDEKLSRQSCQHIIDMLTAMKRHPREPVEAMDMEKILASKNELVWTVRNRHRTRHCRFPQLASDPVSQWHAGSRTICGRDHLSLLRRWRLCRRNRLAET